MRSFIVPFSDAPACAARRQGDGDRTRSHACILERTINVIVSLNLAHEGEYNYSLAFSRIYMQMTVPLLICYFCTIPADEAEEGKGREKKRGDGEIFDFAEVISLGLRSEEEMWSICLINYY